MEIKYNNPIEVNKAQYDYLMKECVGMIAGRFDYESRKYFIKVWIMSCAEFIKDYLNKIRIPQ